MDFKPNNKPIYLQIADKICDEITVGKYAEGDRIPSVREYASELQVNANTMMRVYDYLSDAQIIFNKRGVGYFVAENARQRIVDARYNEFVTDEIHHLFSRLTQIGITPEQLSDMYTKYLINKKSQEQ